jgi:hypothetical protein
MLSPDCLGVKPYASLLSSRVEHWFVDACASQLSLLRKAVKNIDSPQDDSPETSEFAYSAWPLTKNSVA